MRRLGVALRRLWHQPSFAVAAIGTLALGIVAPTALFTVVNATLLRPLPYTRPQDIYTVRTTMTDGRFTIGLVASEELDALRRATDAIAASAMVRRGDETILTDAMTRQVTAFGVSEGFFELFGVPMAMGRNFSADEYRSQTVRSAVLSHHAWQTIFGGDPNLVGETIRLASGTVLVVGVAPVAFDVPHDADLWVAYDAGLDIGHTYDAYVRFKPGLTPGTIQGPMAPMWAALAAKYPDMEKSRAFVMRPLLESIVGDLGPIVLIAFAATGLLFLLALVNVANLLLARGAARSREIAVRTALGATRWHLARQLLAESLLIAVTAAIVGLPIAYAAVRAIVVIGGSALPRVEWMRFDPFVWLFTVVVVVVAGVLVGLIPALTMADGNLAELANEGGRGGLQGRTTRRLLGVMIVAEVTLAIALVAGAGRLLLSVQHLLAIDPGFTAEGRLAVDVLLPRQTYADPVRSAVWAQQVEERLHALGATEIGAASTLPLRHEWDSTAFVDIVDHPTDPAKRPNGRIRVVSPGFFDALRIKIVAGRNFTVDDRRDGAPVVLVNRSWVRKFIPDLDPLRQRLVVAGSFAKLVATPGGRQIVQSDAAIVGVVDDVAYSGLTRDPEPVVYISDAQQTLLRQSVVITTADGHPERLVPQIRAELKKIDPQVPVDFEPMSHAVSVALMWPKLGLLLMGTFGLAALCLAGTGVFGVIAYVVAQRSGEMAVRLALGATRRQVFGLVVMSGARLAMIGLVFGVLLAWWMGQLMGKYVYHVSAANVVVLAGSAVLVLVVSLVATLPAARQAAVITPARALKS